MELKNTVQGMCSSDYKERFCAEYCQLKIRYEKLKATNVKYIAGKLTFTPNCSLELLKKQQSLMGQLLEVLEVRALIEGVELPKVDFVDDQPIKVSKIE